MSRPAVLKFAKILENKVAYERNLADKWDIKILPTRVWQPRKFSEGV
jgi:hypothetical protein